MEARREAERIAFALAGMVLIAGAVVGGIGHAIADWMMHRHRATR